MSRLFASMLVILLLLACTPAQTEPSAATTPSLSSEATLPIATTATSAAPPATPATPPPASAATLTAVVEYVEDYAGNTITLQPTGQGIRQLVLAPTTTIQRADGQAGTLSDILQCATLTAQGSQQGEAFQAAQIAIVEVAEAPAGQYTAQVGAESLNLRANPIPGVAVLETLASGTSLALRGRCRAWLAVTAPSGQRGWVLAQFVTLGPEAQQLPILPETPGSEVPPTSPETGASPTSFIGIVTGIVYNPGPLATFFSATLAAGDGGVATISYTDETLILVASGVAGSFNDIRQCSTISATGQLEGSTLLAERIEVIEVAPLPIGQVTVQAVVEPINVMGNPNATSQVDDLPQGTTLRARGRCGDWLLVTTPENQDGWVLERDVMAFDAQLPTVAVFPEITGGDMGMDATVIFNGTVQAVDPANRVLFIEPANAYDSVAIYDHTTFAFQDGRAATLADVQPGARIEVTGGGGGGGGGTINANRIVILP